MTHVLLLNGPPGCGKDSIADELCKPGVLHMHTVHEKFANPIRAMICGLLGVEDDILDSIKDEPITFLDHATPREYMIQYSEDFIKARLGHAVWGRALRRRIMRRDSTDSIFAVSDAGFNSEIQALIEFFGFSRIVLVQVYRKGCSFGGDSRSYVDPPNITTHRVWNDGELLDTVKEIQGIVANWAL